MRLARLAFAIGLAFLTSTAVVKPAAAKDSQARHVIHADFSSVVIFLGASINYEYHFNENVAVRVGYGASMEFFLTDFHGATGPLAALVLIFGGERHHFELDLGLSLVLARHPPPALAPVFEDGYLGPILFVGYRYQREQGGLLFRIGATWEAGYSIPASVGLGYAF